VQLASPGIEAGLPRWSPDGKAIAFAGRTRGKPWSIYSIASSGGQSKQLTAEGLDEASPDWSPDGTRLAYCRLPFSATTEDLVLRVLDLATGQVTTLRHSLGLCAPRWSPDGRYLAASSKSENGFSIVLFDFENSKWLDLVPIEGFFRLAWSRNGQHLYYYDYPPQGPAVFRVRIGDRKIERVVRLDQMKLLTTDLGTWTMGLAPDESPLEVRDAGSQELYALDVKLP
jgi:WD40 repeat protein